MEVSYDNYLAHYGVKGMRWGVRKDQYRSYKDVATKVENSTTLDRAKANVGMYRYFATGGRMKSAQQYNEEWYNHLDTGKKYIKKRKNSKPSSSRCGRKSIRGASLCSNPKRRFGDV